MSIVFKNGKGCLLDQRSYVNKGFERCYRDGRTRREFKCCFKNQYFDILKPHIKSSSVSETDADRADLSASLLTKSDLLLNTTTLNQSRKRKHKELNQGEIDAQDYHKTVRTVIAEGVQPFVEKGLACGYFTEVGDEKPPLPTHDDGLAGLCDMAKQLPLVDDSENCPVQVIGNDKDSLDQLDLFTRVTGNQDECAREVMLMGERYLIPPRCSFLLSDITKLQPLLNYGKKFDAIVLDPPWENKSVKRSNRYASLPSSQLAQVPVPALSAPGCLVATWVTNRQRHRRFVREELYPQWGVEVQAEWLWVKVTRLGEFVFPLDSPHKKPYEVLILGRRGDAGSTSCSSWTTLPDHHLIVSIPSTLHSHKPSLAEVLLEFLCPGAKCLELFARNLQPGWTSWGNEVLKFQHRSYFEMEPEEASALALCGSSCSETLPAKS